VKDYWPLVLAFAAGVGAIFAAAQITSRLAPLLAVVLFTPLAAMAHLGMEHTLHIALTLLFAWRASKAIAENRQRDGWLVALTPFLVMTRFESLFLVSISAFLLARRRSFALAASLIVAAAVPVTLYGFVALAHGWFFLPNSVLLKGAVIGPDYFASFVLLVFHVFLMLYRAPHLIGVVAALIAALYATRSSAPTHGRILLWLSLLSVLAHLTFADVGWIFRYEAYLIALSVVGIAAAWPLIQRKRVAYAVTACAAAVLLYRSGHIFLEKPAIANGIYSQQYQMARFVARYYPAGSVAANDIGVIDYRADLHLLDLTGLADPEILRAKRNKSYTTDKIAAEANKRGVTLAIVYDDWFSNHPTVPFGGPPLPSTWLRVGRWHTSNGSHLGADTVSFYAVQPAEQRGLREHLQAFR
jgi:hypothetical protein